MIRVDAALAAPHTAPTWVDITSDMVVPADEQILNWLLFRPAATWDQPWSRFRVVSVTSGGRNVLADVALHCPSGSGSMAYVAGLAEAARSWAPTGLRSADPLKVAAAYLESVRKATQQLTDALTEATGVEPGWLPRMRNFLCGMAAGLRLATTGQPLAIELNLHRRTNQEGATNAVNS